MLLQKYDHHLMARIKTLALPKAHERNLSMLVQLQNAGSSDLASTGDKLKHRKRNLKTLLPALTDIWLESHVVSLVRSAEEKPLLRAYFEEKVQTEEDRVSRVVSFWAPLVQRVHVEEVQDK